MTSLSKPVYMECDPSGIWQGSCETSKHNITSISTELLNNVKRTIKSESHIKYTKNEKANIYVFTDSGEGFTEDAFDKACILAMSDRSGINNFGFGLKSILQLKNMDGTFFIHSRSLNKTVGYKSQYGKLPEKIMDENLSSLFKTTILDNSTWEYDTLIMGIYKPDIHNWSLDNILNSYTEKQEQIDEIYEENDLPIQTIIAERYCKCIQGGDKIYYNDVEIKPIEILSKDLFTKGSDVKYSLRIDAYGKQVVVTSKDIQEFNNPKQRDGRNKKLMKFCKDDPIKMKKMTSKESDNSIELIIGDINREIWTDNYSTYYNDYGSGHRKKIYIELCGIIIAEEDINIDGWPNIRVILHNNKDDTNILNKNPNKTKTTIMNPWKKIINDLIKYVAKHHIEPLKVSKEQSPEHVSQLTTTTDTSPRPRPSLIVATPSPVQEEEVSSTQEPIHSIARTDTSPSSPSLSPSSPSPSPSSTPMEDQVYVTPEISTPRTPVDNPVTILTQDDTSELAEQEVDTEEEDTEEQPKSSKKKKRKAFAESLINRQYNNGVKCPLKGIPFNVWGEIFPDIKLYDADHIDNDCSNNDESNLQLLSTEAHAIKSRSVSQKKPEIFDELIKNRKPYIMKYLKALIKYNEFTSEDKEILVKEIFK